MYAYRNANNLNDDIRKKIKKVCEDCKVCRKLSRSLGRPKVTNPKVVNFNKIVSMDLKQFGKKYGIWMICMFIRICKEKS